MDYVLEVDAKNALQKFCGNDESHLRKVVNGIVRKYGGLHQKDMDDFYSIAHSVIWDIVQPLVSPNDKRGHKSQYDQSKGSLEGYIFRAIKYKIMDAISNRNALKRNPHDKDGNIYSVLSFETPVGEGDSSTIGDFLCSKPSDFDIMDELDRTFDTVGSENATRFLQELPKIQRKIVMMRMYQYTNERIMQTLNLTQREFYHELSAIQTNKNLSLLNKSTINGSRKEQGANVMDVAGNANVDLMLDLDTTDSYRIDKRSLKSLIDDKTEGNMNCGYISQRQPFQWDEELVNKYYARILNNQPIPEIVICEMVEDGRKEAYLIDGLQRMTYAEAFRENRIPVGKKGVLFPVVQYKKFVKDEYGKKVFDEKDRPMFTVEQCDIVGKYYKDLPEFLQKRFDDFNITVTRFFNCTPEIIDYHMVNYNNHKSMTKSQYGIAMTSNRTSKRIKDITEHHAFFKDCVSCSNKKRRQGFLEEMLARTFMSTYFVKDWKKDLLDTMKYVDEHLTSEQYEHMVSNLDRLSRFSDKTVKSMLTTTDTHIWLAVFENFTKLNLDDEKFICFMKEFESELHSKVVDGMSYDTLKEECRNTKDKRTVVSKIELISALMCDYLKIESVEDDANSEMILSDTWQDYVSQFGVNDFLKTLNISNADLKNIAIQSAMLVNGENDLSVASMQRFVKQIDMTEQMQSDVQMYLDMLDSYSLELDSTYCKIAPDSIPTLIGVMKYSFHREVDDVVVVNLLKKYVNKLSAMDYKKKADAYFAMITELGKVA